MAVPASPPCRPASSLKVKIPALEIGALLQGELVPQEWSFGAFLPAWWPAITWPHYVLIGTAATVAVASLFRTRRSSLAAVPVLLKL
jgi:hypothetical protein